MSTNMYTVYCMYNNIYFYVFAVTVLQGGGLVHWQLQQGGDDSTGQAGQQQQEGRDHQQHGAAPGVHTHPQPHCLLFVHSLTFSRFTTRELGNNQYGSNQFSEDMLGKEKHRLPQSMVSAYKPLPYVSQTDITMIVYSNQSIH